MVPQVKLDGTVKEPITDSTSGYHLLAHHHSDSPPLPVPEEKPQVDVEQTNGPESGYVKRVGVRNNQRIGSRLTTEFILRTKNKSTNRIQIRH